MGGFFPLLLARDYGWPALAAFTIFNIGGAMAMGFYFKSPKQQLQFESRHKGAISAFSCITIAYQLFFIAWLGALIGQPFMLGLVLALVLVFWGSGRIINYWALALYVVSILLFIGFVGRDWQPVELSVSPYWAHTILPLAIGFVLSPYLDITFHRAYKNSSHPRLSYALGFGILFLSLIVFVFFYAGSLGEIFFNQSAPAFLIYPVIAFLVLQTAFTISAHCIELSSQQYAKPFAIAASLILVSLILTLLVFLTHGESIPWIGLPFEETIYKGFLFFYSLVFPLYLILGRARRLYFGVLAACTPAYAVGFLVDLEYSFALSIGAAILLLAGLSYRRMQN